MVSSSVWLQAKEAAEEAALSLECLLAVVPWESSPDGKRALFENRVRFNGAYPTQGGQWKVVTLKSWGVRQRLLAVVSTQEEAEAIPAMYNQRLEAAAAVGNFDVEFRRVDDEIVAHQVRFPNVCTV